MAAGRRGRSWPLLGLLALLVIVGTAYLVGGTEGSGSGSRAPATAVAVEDLPAEVGETLALIDRGGPFPDERDGAVFENREGLLPAQDLGYYREYTVPTPGEEDRGPQRLVTGDDGAAYYTADHYASFVRIRGP